MYTKNYEKTVSVGAVKAYTEKKNSILHVLNRKIQAASDLYLIIGGEKNVQTMLDNHRNHVAFLGIVFQLQNFQLLAQTLPWVYRSYHNIGFSYDYFLLELKCWIEAITNEIDHPFSQEIVPVYHWMIENHEKSIHESRKQPEMRGIDAESTRDQRAFEQFLIQGDQRAAFEVVQTYVSDIKDLKSFYDKFIRRSMYRIGMLWETGVGSVAAEHLSSAIVTRILSAMYTQIELPDISKGKILVCSAANEYHEIGAWMVANVFETEGWDVQYLGANTPLTDLMQMMEQFQPDILGLSVTIPYNLEHCSDLVARIRSQNTTTKIFVGGSLAVAFPELHEDLPIDYIATGFDDAVAVAEGFWREMSA